MPGQAGKYSSSQQNGTVVSRATSSTATSSAMLAPPPNPGIKARSHSPTHVAAQAARGLVWCLTSTACAPGALYLGAAAPPDAPPPRPTWEAPLPWRNEALAAVVWRECARMAGPYLSPLAKEFVA